MTMTFYVLSVQYVSYSLLSKTVHYIDTMTEKMFGFSIFIDSSSLEGYKFRFFCRILHMLPHQSSMWISYFGLLLLPHFLYPVIQPYEFSHSMIWLCCSLCWRCLSNSSLMTNFISSLYIQSWYPPQMPVLLWGLFSFHQVEFVSLSIYTQSPAHAFISWCLIYVHMF